MVNEHYVTDSGGVTVKGHAAIKEMRKVIDNWPGGHTDNTNASCRIDLHGHDCCYLCNEVQAMLQAFIIERGE